MEKFVKHWNKADKLLASDSSNVSDWVHAYHLGTKFNITYRFLFGGIMSGKTKTPQMVTLQVKIESGQKAIKNQHTVPDHVLAYPLRRNFPAQKTTKFSLAVLPFAVFLFGHFLGSYYRKLFSI